MFMAIGMAAASLVLSLAGLLVAVQASRGVNAIWDYLEGQRPAAQREEPREVRLSDMSEAEWLRSQNE